MAFHGRLERTVCENFYPSHFALTERNLLRNSARMRKNKEFNELESLKSFSTLFSVRRPIYWRVKEGRRSLACLRRRECLFDFLNDIKPWVSSKDTASKRFPQSLVIKSFLWPFPSFFCSFASPKQRTIAGAIPVPQIIEKHRLMTTCARREREKRFY